MKVTKQEILEDYKIAILSRELSMAGRREVLNGRAKFGVFSDGKELPQIVMSKFIKKGDFVVGYYREQTTALKLGIITPHNFFAQIYAHADIKKEPSSGGRSMVNHISTRLVDNNCEWISSVDKYNFCCDISSLAGQFPKAIGLAQASNIFKTTLKGVNGTEKFSDNGKEVVFATTGDGTTSEGIFFETINAISVLQVPLIIPIWDDGYSISVPQSYQTPKKCLSDVLSGFEKTKEDEKGIKIIKCNAYDYVELLEAFEKAQFYAREKSIPTVVHVINCTQPQGHSTSGSHEKYKSKERLSWEKNYDCIKIFENWCLENGAITEKEAEKIKKETKILVRKSQREAFNSYKQQFEKPQDELVEILNILSPSSSFIFEQLNHIENMDKPSYNVMISIAKRILLYENKELPLLSEWIEKYINKIENIYDTYTYSEKKNTIKNIVYVKPKYDEEKYVDGREIIRDSFDKFLENYPEIFIFGQDCGKLGDVNHGLEGLQEKYGEERVFDCGIREVTILGQGTGMSMRGLKPIAEIQYLDYLVYALQHITDDIACLHYRTCGQQKAPIIIRTRGHRLEGIWHSGSPIAMILNSIRGMYLAVPRNFTQASGIYNTILKTENPAIVIEPLNRYRDKEKYPSNIGDFYVPIGVPEIINKGNDITLVTYGSCCKIALDAASELKALGISLEVIDVQTLLPFDKKNIIIESIKKTNKVIFFDEDMPGGTTAFMLDMVLTKRNGYKYLDAKPITISAKPHRPPYGNDGDYASKPSVDSIFEACSQIINE